MAVDSLNTFAITWNNINTIDIIDLSNMTTVMSRGTSVLSNYREKVTFSQDS